MKDIKKETFALRCREEKKTREKKNVPKLKLKKKKSPRNCYPAKGRRMSNKKKGQLK